MKSSTGQHFKNLDHIRGFAAILVVSWHFTHADNGYPVAFGTAPLLSIFDEGHTGVALFMTLSGYLFAQLTYGRDMILLPFLWNRLLRLAPLLVVASLVAGVEQVVLLGGEADDHIPSLILGATMPMWPRGAWSIVVEAHFYILLPIVLALARRRPWAVLVFLAIALALRGATWLTAGNVQMLAYKTIVGRIDQFVLGVVVFYLRPSITNRVAAGAALAFFAFYAAFDAVGGYTRTEHSPVWIFLPSIEGAAYAVLISWYDARPGLIGGWGAALLQRAGEYSYSIYLLHFFFFAPAAKFVDTNIMSISQLYLALPWSLAFFGAMMCVGHLVYHCFEKPFLKMRLRYTRDAPGTTMVQEDAQSAPARFVTAHSPDFDPADAREIAR